MKKRIGYIVIVGLVSAGAIWASDDISAGFRTIGQGIKKGVQAAGASIKGGFERNVTAKASPAMQKVAQYTRDLGGLSACIQKNNCNPQQLQQFNLAVKGIKALIVAGLIAGAGYAAYRGEQKYGYVGAGAKAVRGKVALNIEALTAKLSGSSKILLVKIGSLFLPGKSMTEGESVKLAEDIEASIKNMKKEEQNKFLLALNNLKEYAQGLVDYFRYFYTIAYQAVEKVGSAQEEAPFDPSTVPQPTNP